MVKCLKALKSSSGAASSDFVPCQMKPKSFGEYQSLSWLPPTTFSRISFHHLLSSLSAHEYTSSNAKFAASVEPGNADLLARIEQIGETRSRGEPTVPTLLGEEKRTNPFLRCDISDEIRMNVGVEETDSAAMAFGKVRRAKDSF